MRNKMSIFNKDPYMSEAKKKRIIEQTQDIADFFDDIYKNGISSSKASDETGVCEAMRYDIDSPEAYSRIIKDDNKLSSKDSKIVADALINDDEPNDKLKSLMSEMTDENEHEDYFSLKALQEDIDALERTSGDPKARMGNKKMGFTHLPMSLLLNTAKNMKYGANEYGEKNWVNKDRNLKVNVYLNAAFRHLILYMIGQDLTSDRGTNHLDCVISGLAVIRDAQLLDNWNDDRIKYPKEYIERVEALLADWE